jgi:hypothetical protein
MCIDLKTERPIPLSDIDLKTECIDHRSEDRDLAQVEEQLDQAGI